MILETLIGDEKLIVECEAELQPLATEVMRKLEAANAQGLAMRDGARVQLGWSVITLRADNGRLRVCEPAFNTNPFQLFTPTLDISLRLLDAQVRVLRRVKEEGVDVMFDQIVLAARGALEVPDIYLKRLAPLQNEDSGWFIGDLNQIEDATTEHTEAVPAFKLLRKREAVIQVLALPPGYIVTMKKDVIDQVFDSNGQDRWQLQ